MICNHKNDSPVEEFLELYSKLDVADQAVVTSIIKTLLDAEKYSVKNRILERTDKIIVVDFK